MRPPRRQVIGFDAPSPYAISLAASQHICLKQVKWAAQRFEVGYVSECVKEFGLPWLRQLVRFSIQSSEVLRGPLFCNLAYKVVAEYNIT